MSKVFYRIDRENLNVVHWSCEFTDGMQAAGQCFEDQKGLEIICFSELYESPLDAWHELACHCAKEITRLTEAMNRSIINKGV